MSFFCLSRCTVCWGRAGVCMIGEGKRGRWLRVDESSFRARESGAVNRCRQRQQWVKQGTGGIQKGPGDGRGGGKGEPLWIPRWFSLRFKTCPTRARVYRGSRLPPAVQPTALLLEFFARPPAIRCLRFGAQDDNALHFVHFFILLSRRLSGSIASLEKELTAHPEAGGPAQDVIRERLRRAITRRRKALLFLDAATPPTPEAPTSRAPPQATASTPQEEPGAPPPLDPVFPPHPPAHMASPSPSPPSSSSSSSSSASTPPPLFPPPYYDGGMFCSELVAALYQRLGLLDAPFPARYDYVPADFAQSLGNPTGCLGIDTGEAATLKDGADAEVTASVSRAAVLSCIGSLGVAVCRYHVHFVVVSPPMIAADLVIWLRKLTAVQLMRAVSVVRLCW